MQGYIMASMNISLLTTVHGLKVTKSVHVQYYSKEGEGLG